MFQQKDIITNNLKIVGEKEVSVIQHSNDNDQYLYSALTVEGGGVFKKGLAIGLQEKMVSGLLIYDNENFYGFSDKYGLCLLTNHTEYNELVIPDNIIGKKQEINKIQPTSTNKIDHFKNAVETEKIEEKRLNIDLSIKDSNNFYIVIPESYTLNKLNLIFDIHYIYDISSIITNVSLVFINESNKELSFDIVNKNCYYSDDFSNKIQIKSIQKINLEIINEKYFMVNTCYFHKKEIL
jgi:hypothetical protein